MLDEGTNCVKGEQLWQPNMVQGTIGGVMFGPVGPLATQTTYSATDPYYEPLAWFMIKSKKYKYTLVAYVKIPMRFCFAVIEP